jgi:hypothetical protein
MKFDAETKKCESILEENLLENCMMYKNDGSCLDCAPGFKVNNGSCENLGENAIDNCLSYGENTCLFCDGGFRFDGTKCVEFSHDISGCGV